MAEKKNLKFGKNWRKKHFRRWTRTSTMEAAKGVIKRTTGRASMYVAGPRGKIIRKEAIKLLKRTKKGRAWLKKYLECGYTKTLSGKPCSRPSPGNWRCWQHKKSRKAGFARKAKKRKRKKRKRKLRRKKR